MRVRKQPVRSRWRSRWTGKQKNKTGCVSRRGPSWRVLDPVHARYQMIGRDMYKAPVLMPGKEQGAVVRGQEIEEIARTRGQIKHTLFPLGEGG